MTSASGFVGTMVAYTVARLCIVVAVAGLLVFAGVPLLLAALIGLIAALPLSMLLLRGMRGRFDVAMAAVRERRAAEREVLRARLRGDDAANVAGQAYDGRPVGDHAEADLPDPADRSDRGAQREPDPSENRPGQQ